MSAGLPRWNGNGVLLLSVKGQRPVPVVALLFDLGGTLDADGLGWGERFEALLRAELPDLADAALAGALGAGERSVLRHPRAAQLGLEEMVSLHVHAQLERLGASSPDRASRIGKAFHEETSRAMAGRRPLLERLAAKLSLAVVSNGCGNSATLLSEAGLGHLFRSVIDSSVVGAWKPDPAIFAPALSALGVPPDRAAMVGDRLDRDVAGARNAGCRSIWVSGGRTLSARDPLASAVDAVIGSVEDLDPGAPE